MVDDWSDGHVGARRPALKQVCDRWSMAQSGTCRSHHLYVSQRQYRVTFHKYHNPQWSEVHWGHPHMVQACFDLTTQRRNTLVWVLSGLEVVHLSLGPWGVGRWIKERVSGGGDARGWWLRSNFLLEISWLRSGVWPRECIFHLLYQIPLSWPFQASVRTFSCMIPFPAVSYRYGGIP
jgi:hypothetical protein